MTEGWKKWFIRSAGFGAGAVLTVAVLIGVFVWWSNRPKPPKAWNTKAITASYDEFTTWNTDKGIQAEFVYVLENKSDFDYKMPDTVKIMSRSTTGALDDVGQWVRFDNFIPARQKAKFSFTTQVGDIFDSTKARNDNNELVHTVGAWVSKINGFVIFDGDNRYEIELPAGWQPYVDVNAKKP
jgi:hypothetical protein